MSTCVGALASYANTQASRVQSSEPYELDKGRDKGKGSGKPTGKVVASSGPQEDSAPLAEHATGDDEADIDDEFADGPRSKLCQNSFIILSTIHENR